LQATGRSLFAGRSLRRARHVAEYLAALTEAAVGAGEEQLPFAEPHPFAAGKDRGAQLGTTQAQIVTLRINVIDVEPADGQ
jgi:hypothetical protein